MNNKDLNDYLKAGKEARLKKWVDKQEQKNICKEAQTNTDSYFMDERIAGIEDITDYSSVTLEGISNKIQQYFSDYPMLDEFTKITANLIFSMQPEEKTVRERYLYYVSDVWSDLSIPKEDEKKMEGKKINNMLPTFYYPM